MDLLSLSGLFRLLNLEIESLAKIENINVESLAKFEFNIPIHIVSSGVKVDRPDGTAISHMPSALLLPRLDPASNTLDTTSRAVPLMAAAPTLAEQPQAVQLPFGQGLHYSVNQRSWWASGEHVTLGTTKLVPASFGEMVTIARIGPGVGQPRFRLRATPAGQLAFSPEPGPEPLTELGSAASPYKDGSETWRFTWFDSHSVVTLPGLTSTLVSFDPTVASGAWLIDYERTDRPPTVRYLLAFLTDKQA